MDSNQIVASQNIPRTRRPRLCGRCKCPGHRGDTCNVIEVMNEWNAMKTVMIDMTLPPEERFAIRINNQANSVIKEIRKIYNRGVRYPYKFREQYIQEYFEKEENKDVNPNHIPYNRRAYNVITNELRVALENKRGKQEPEIWELEESLKEDLINIWNQEYRNYPCRVSTRRKELAHNRKVEEYERIVLIRSIATQHRTIQQQQQSQQQQQIHQQAFYSKDLQVKDKVIDETVCPICLDELTDCNKMVSACGHQFHANCIIKMSMNTNNANKNKCPCCRSEIF